MRIYQNFMQNSKSKSQKTVFLGFFTIVAASCLLLLSACQTAQKPAVKNIAEHCVEPLMLYRMADKRTIEPVLLQKAIDCPNVETTKVAAIALGRIGGEEAARLLLPLLQHSSPKVRATAAFSLGVSGKQSAVSDLIQQVTVEAARSKSDSQVMFELAKAVGNLGSPAANDFLIQKINQSQDLDLVNGALQGLGLLSVWDAKNFKPANKLPMEQFLPYLKHSKTSLNAAFLLARTKVVTAQDLPKLIAIVDQLDKDSQAYLIRSMGYAKSEQGFDLFLRKAQSDDIGIRVSALGALARTPHKNKRKKVSQLVKNGDVITQVTALGSLGAWIEPALLKQLAQDDSSSSNSWVQSLAFAQIAKHQISESKTFLEKLAHQWSESDEPNLQRAAANYFVKQNNPVVLKKLLKSSKPIIKNAAETALKIAKKPKDTVFGTPEKISDLPSLLVLKTTKGDIKIKLYQDTPYAAENFIRLAKTGFYDNSYFHRVIPNFVAQGGSNNGDGSGMAGYSIRDEINPRSHTLGTIGLANSGKDTGGANFFINLAPNLHLDSRYTVFGEVVEGIANALKLQQNDQIISVIFSNSE